MIPFGLFILRCELAHCQGKTKQSIDKFAELLAYQRSLLAKMEGNTNNNNDADDAAAIQSPTQPLSPLSRNSDGQPVSRPSSPGIGGGILLSLPSVSSDVLRSRIRLCIIQLANYHLLLPLNEVDYIAAINLLKPLQEEEELNNNNNNNNNNENINLISLIGRIYLQSGDIFTASMIFDKIEKNYNKILLMKN